ncbi:heme-binding protein, partial [Mycobacteroides abscessus subsp. massiliense]|uniref:heme-binding protein n=1 Tax=Mycobacteroides abscessus TaxID=36809 RepID=UPI003CFACC93
LSMGAASANADEIPNCTAADLAGITSGVAAATSVYMYTHPEVNDFFTGLKGKSAQDIKVAVREYMSANPDIREDLRQIRQPMIVSEMPVDVSEMSAHVSRNVRDV